MTSNSCDISPVVFQSFPNSLALVYFDKHDVCAGSRSGPNFCKERQFGVLIIVYTSRKCD